MTLLLRALRVTVALPAAPVSKLSRPRHAVPSPLAIYTFGTSASILVHVRTRGLPWDAMRSCGRRLSALLQAVNQMTMGILY